MTYKYSWWRSLPYVLGGVFFLAIAWLSGRSAHSDIDRAGTLGLASFGVWMLGEIRKVSEVVRLDDIGITRRYLGSEDAMLWGEVASVRFQAYRTVLSARNGKRISIGRYHPAYQATTQSAIDRLRPIWEAGLGRDYRLSLPWALSFSIFLGFVVVLGIRFLLANGDNLGLGLFITSGGLLLLGLFARFPRRLQLLDGGIRVDTWFGSKYYLRSDIASADLSTFGRSDQQSLLVSTSDGKRIQFSFLHDGQIEPWLALNTWIRG